MVTVIDIHAHYVPAELISFARGKGAQLGVRLVEDAATPALHFDYGFKVRPFFPKLIEPVAQRIPRFLNCSQKLGTRRIPLV
jgi:aminocarboxymuconate-semialdehyde decarboxylase